MRYPAEVDQFTVKLNKKEGSELYVIEEQLAVLGGVFEGDLAHDDIRKDSIQVYTGPGLSGEKIHNYFLTVPAETPWRLRIKLFAQAEAVFVTYETPGDRVEAADINDLQVSISATQLEVERYKKSGSIDGGSFLRRN
ncbi:phosphoglucomutase [Paenibacillus sp. TAF43_2]|uniref:phosphoglucomutase n=1 Tax=Paenibacillus sp. TAF43_2 TaxID=3233069 RepID=UPI003F9EB12A